MEEKKEQISMLLSRLKNVALRRMLPTAPARQSFHPSHLAGQALTPDTKDRKS
jgi:hypothetical protein